MLIGPKRTPALDDHVHIVLRLRGGEQVQVSAVVRRREGAGQVDHHHALLLEGGHHCDAAAVEGLERPRHRGRSSVMVFTRLRALSK